MALIGEMKYLTIGGNTYSIPTVSTATSTTLGGIKIGYSESNKNYAVQLDNNGKAFVTVPWVDIPTVSSSDNGKVLMVVNGVWTKASLPTYNGGVS